MGMCYTEIEMIRKSLKDAVVLNEKIITQIDFLVNCVNDKVGHEGEKIRQGCKQLILVSGVLKGIVSQIRERHCSFTQVLMDEYKKEDAVQFEIWQSKENAKKEMSQEVFHSIGQTLFSLYLILNRLNEILYQEGLKKELDILEDMIVRTIKKVKDSAFELYPLILEDLGVVPTFKSYSAYLQEKELLDIPFNVTGELSRLGTDCEIKIFRTSQEFLHTLLKHSQTNKLNIEFNEYFNKITVQFAGTGSLMNLFKKPGVKRWNERLKKMNTACLIQESPEGFKVIFSFHNDFEM